MRTRWRSGTGRTGCWMTIEAPRSAPAAERNKEPILTVLQRVLPQSGVVLEIASGTGQHVVHFARALPGLTWQPSEPDPQMRPSIAAWLAEAALPNVLLPIELDVMAVSSYGADTKSSGIVRIGSMSSVSVAVARSSRCWDPAPTQRPQHLVPRFPRCRADFHQRLQRVQRRDIGQRGCGDDGLAISRLVGSCG